MFEAYLANNDLIFTVKFWFTPVEKKTCPNLSVCGVFVFLAALFEVLFY